MPRPKRDIDPITMLKVAELFFENKTATQIAKQLNKDLPTSKQLTRESIYPILALARSAGIVTLVAPLDQQLTTEVCKRFRVPESDVKVVVTSRREPEEGADTDTAAEHVASSAADVAIELIDSLKRRKGPDGAITLGLGPGRATLDFSRSLGEKLSRRPQKVKLRLVAISAGGPSRKPEYVPSSFFSLYPPKTECIGFFSQPMARFSESDAIYQSPVVQDVLSERDSIDIVVTAMGDLRDSHDLLRAMFEQQGVKVDELVNRGWLGNVQYRPYTSTGPVEEGPDDYRAITMFDLKGFVDLAQKRDKYVILMARQCGLCNMTRAAALAPLLTVPALRVWNKLCMDVETAQGLLSSSQSTNY